MFTRVRHWSLSSSQMNPIHGSNHVSMRSILMLFSHLHIGLCLAGKFSQGQASDIWFWMYLLSHRFYQFFWHKDYFYGESEHRKKNLSPQTSAENHINIDVRKLFKLSPQITQSSKLEKSKVEAMHSEMKHTLQSWVNLMHVSDISDRVFKAREPGSSFSKETD
jgi:hypothetical protein